MQSTAKHIGLFRRVYNFAPCGNIASSVMVCIGNTATMFAAKAFPFSFANPKTISTHLRSVGGWDIVRGIRDGLIALLAIFLMMLLLC